MSGVIGLHFELPEVASHGALAVRRIFLSQEVLLVGRQDLSKMTTDQENFLAQREQPNGKKTMKSYLWSLELETYDAQH